MATNKEKLKLINATKMTIDQLNTNFYAGVCKECTPFIINFEDIDFEAKTMFLKVFVFDAKLKFNYIRFYLGFYWKNDFWSPNTIDYIECEEVIEKYAKKCNCY